VAVIKILSEGLIVLSVEIHGSFTVVAVGTERTNPVKFDDLDGPRLPIAPPRLGPNQCTVVFLGILPVN
jgi:hypothetical protein